MSGFLETTVLHASLACQKQSLAVLGHTSKSEAFPIFFSQTMHQKVSTCSKC